MVILKEEVGSERVELQQHPVIVPTATWNVLNQGDKNKLTNTTLKYVVLSWDGDDLVNVTPSAAWQGALNQYRVRVQQVLSIDVPDLVCGKTTPINGHIVDAEAVAMFDDPVYARSSRAAAYHRR